MNPQEQLVRYIDNINVSNNLFYVDETLIRQVMQNQAEILKPPGVIPKKYQKNRYLIKGMDVDITDLLLHLVKEQPRIVNNNNDSKYWHEQVQAVEHARGRTVHNYERDLQLQRKQFNIYYNDWWLARITCKPHLTVELVRFRQVRARARYAQQLMIKAVNDYFPYAKLSLVDQ